MVAAGLPKLSLLNERDVGLYQEKLPGWPRQWLKEGENHSQLKSYRIFCLEDWSNDRPLREPVVGQYFIVGGNHSKGSCRRRFAD